MLPDPGLYVHLPWCVRKCPYCDFNSHPLKSEQNLDDYVDALLDDFESRQSGLAFASVFFGGGTPSLFHPEHFDRLISAFPLLPDAEITLEANPGTTEHADFSAYARAGITRVSIGAQSFDDDHLSKLGRIHSAREVAEAISAVAESDIETFNVDLMWGLPGQTTAQALLDLDRALEFNPDHLSWYQLTIEAKTEFARRPPILPKDQVLAEIEAEGLPLIETRGLRRYEVSAFAANDRQCLHNLNYWRFGDYVGLGAGAHGKETGQGEIWRTQKPHQPRLYLDDPARTARHRVEPCDVAFEFMLNALRLTDGVCWPLFETRTGLSRQTIASKWQALHQRGLVEPDRCACTKLGYRYLDSVVAEFTEM